ncbi:polysaccharide biosynthesis/export family protein [Luteitalea sp.]|uniref:polysaccharide biosynthesis/export family protein n=1 Tax=Luteitalea sp. TaxID=2004800 RepID=UPI0025C306D6|nr:polysaccharide biosynthesis/export family protein [Luteitalea sp.]
MHITRLTLALVVLGATIDMAGAAQVASPAAPSAQPSAADVSADFTIGPEDVLGVVFWREAELSGDVTVRPDGKITLPVIGEVQAAGKRPQDLQAEIMTHAGKYLTDPNVVVVVRAINSRRIFVTGRVTSPGGHVLKGPLNVVQALALAGGLTEYANAKNISILRTVNGRTERFKFNYREVTAGKSLEQNIVLRPGDTVVVP